MLPDMVVDLEGDVVTRLGRVVGLAVDRAKAPRTVQTYLDGLDHFERFLAERGMPPDVGAIRRDHVDAFLVALQEAGRRPASVANRYRSLQQFFRWPVEDNEIPVSPMARCARPRCPSSRPRC